MFSAVIFSIGCGLDVAESVCLGGVVETGNDGHDGDVMDASGDDDEADDVGVSGDDGKVRNVVDYGSVFAGKFPTFTGQVSRCRDYEQMFGQATASGFQFERMAVSMSFRQPRRGKLH